MESTLIGRSHYFKEYILGRLTNQPLEIFMRLKIEVMREIFQNLLIVDMHVLLLHETSYFFPCKTSFRSISHPCGTISLNTLLFPKSL